MSLTAYVANALIAAALGAGTNELAIVAILRYILPRKKAEIARRIRDIVATELISPEKMRQKLDEPQVGAVLRKYIDEAIGGFLDRDLPAPDEALADHIGELDSLVDRAREALLGEFSRRVAEPGFADAVVRPFLAERWEALRDRTPRSFLHSHAESLPRLAGEWTRSFEQSDYMRDKMRRGLDRWLSDRLERSRTPADFLSPGAVEAAEELAASQTEAVTTQLTELLRQRDVAETINNAIMAAIRRQLSGQGFLGGLKSVAVSALKIENDVAGVVQRLPDALRDNFLQPHNRAKLARTLRNAVRQGLRKDMAETFRDGETRGKIVDFIMARLWRAENFARLGERVERAVARSLDQPLTQLADKAGLDGSAGDLLDEVAARVCRMLSAPATRELLAGQFDEIVAVWRRRPLGRLGRFVDDETRRRVSDAVAEEVRLMLRQRLDQFAEESGVWDIVVTSIEGFDDDQLADLIKQLARSELRMVTVLGGVIGLFVGIAQTFLNARGWI